jgi:hypothetical protein
MPRSTLQAQYTLTIPEEELLNCSKQEAEALVDFACDAAREFIRKSLGLDAGLFEINRDLRRKELDATS